MAAACDEELSPCRHPSCETMRRLQRTQMGLPSPSLRGVNLCFSTGRMYCSQGSNFRERSLHLDMKRHSYTAA